MIDQTIAFERISPARADVRRAMTHCRIASRVQETRAGTAATTNRSEMDQCMAMKRAAATGPTIEPMRPMPSVQPTPVALSSVG
jgi:hypothetical protein